VNVAGLLDEATTERIRMNEWLRKELAATGPAKPSEARLEPEPVAAGGRGASSDSRVARPKRRAKRSGGTKR
jgi:hypothetical protein